jgi:hypothetical protein
MCQRCIKARLQSGGYRDLTIIQYKGTKTASPHSLTEPLSSTTNSPSCTSPHDFEATIAPGLTIACDEIFMSYILNYLLRGLHDSQVIDKQNITRNRKEKCYLALSTTYFGAGHMDKSILQQGFRRYGLVLEQIHEALGDSSRYLSFDLLEQSVW